MLADLVKTEAAMEQQGRVCALFDKHFRNQGRRTYFSETVDIGIEQAPDTGASLAFGNDATSWLTGKFNQSLKTDQLVI